MIKVMEDKNKKCIFKNNHKKERFQEIKFLKAEVRTVEYQELGTHALRYNLTIIRNSDDNVLTHAFGPEERIGGAQAAIDAASEAIDRRIGIENIRSYEPIHNSNIFQLAILSKHSVSKVPAKFSYFVRSIFNMNVSTGTILDFSNSPHR